MKESKFLLNLVSDTYQTILNKSELFITVKTRRTYLSRSLGLQSVNTQWTFLNPNNNSNINMVSFLDIINKERVKVL